LMRFVIGVEAEEDDAGRQIQPEAPPHQRSSMLLYEVVAFINIHAR